MNEFDPLRYFILWLSTFLDTSKEPMTLNLEVSDYTVNVYKQNEKLIITESSADEGVGG